MRRVFFVLFAALSLFLWVPGYADAMPEQFFFSFPIDINEAEFAEYIQEMYGYELQATDGIYTTFGYIPWHGESVSMTYAFHDGTFTSTNILLSNSVHGETFLEPAMKKFLEICEILQSMYGPATDGWILTDGITGMFAYDYPLKDGLPDNEQVAHLLQTGRDPFLSAWLEFGSTSVSISRSIGEEPSQNVGNINVHYLSPNAVFVRPTEIPFHGPEGVYIP